MELRLSERVRRPDFQGDFLKMILRVPGILFPLPAACPIRFPFLSRSLPKPRGAS